jgi:hypothetical protein
MPTSFERVLWVVGQLSPRGNHVFNNFVTSVLATVFFTANTGLDTDERTLTYALLRRLWRSGFTDSLATQDCG